MKKAISANIFKHDNRSFSNGGISERFNEVLIEHEKGFIEFDETNPPENLVRVIKRDLFGKTYLHLEPFKTNGEWLMYGGCFCYSSDARFNEISENPLMLHDRVE